MQWIESECHSSYQFVCPQFSVFSQAPSRSPIVPSGGPMEQQPSKGALSWILCLHAPLK